MGAERIAQLNDAFRKTGAGGQIFITAGVHALPEHEQMKIVEKVRMFDQFNAANDPYGEHDFGSIDHEGHEIFFKIDYYGPDLMQGSDDPEDTEQTVRVMTVMLAHEY